MGKIALLVSREEMIHQAHNILQEKKFEIQEMRVIHTGDTVMEHADPLRTGRQSSLPAACKHPSSSNIPTRR